MIRTTLYFGSFNPIHNGHTAIARYLVEQMWCDELWFVVSPQNPLKQSFSLAPEQMRLDMVSLAVKQMSHSERALVCGIEFDLPKPSYTINTLRALSSKYPERNFSLLIGSDIVQELDKWKDYKEILEYYPLFVYPRNGYRVDRFREHLTILDNAPTWDFSSTDVRNRLSLGKSVDDMICSDVYQYIKKHRLWI